MEKHKIKLDAKERFDKSYKEVSDRFYNRVVTSFPSFKYLPMADKESLYKEYFRLALFGKELEYTNKELISAHNDQSEHREEMMRSFHTTI